MKNSKLEKKKRKEHKKQLKNDRKKNVHKKATQRKVLKYVLIIFTLIIISAIGGLSFYLYNKLSKLETVVIDKKDLEINAEVEGADFGEGYFNVALFGVDSRTGNVEAGTLSDTIMVASLNNQTKELRLVSVYRDTLLNIGGGTFNKANAAYSVGGATKAINMLNTNLDLNIEKYVAVDFSIMVDIIDALGGVEIEIDSYEISAINKYIPETAQASGGSTKLISSSGLQLLNGVQATTYARIRSTAGGDFRRTDRQRYVIEQMIKKIKKSNFITLNSIIDLALPRVSTNFTASEIAYYASAYLDFYLGATTGFPEKYASGTLPTSGSTVVPQTLSSNVSVLHEFLFEVKDYKPSSTVNSNSSQILAKASGYVGGVANSNTGYSTNSETNISNLGIGEMSTNNEEVMRFDNPVITFN